MRDFVQSNKDHMMSRKMNESTSYGYDIMSFMSTANDARDYTTTNKDEASTAMYFLSSKQNIKDFQMTYYNFLSFNEKPTTNALGSYGLSGFNENLTIDPLPNYVNNSVIYENEMSSAFLYAKICIYFIIVIIGLFGNSFSFLIVVKQGLVKSGVWVYIASLAITDSIALIMYAITEFSKPPVNLLSNMPNSNAIMCKAMTSFGYLWALMSNYIACFMTIERCIIILNPYRVPPGQKQATLQC